MSKMDIKKRHLFRRQSQAVINNLMPWIHDGAKFTDNCTQCKRCLTDCPESIIAQGDGGFPVIDFSLGECSFCGQCAESCPEDIFVDINQIPWHKKAIIDDTCLANQNIACRSCGESCPEQALSFQVGINATPEINLELCNGCGACFSTCPTSAISVKEK